MQNEEESLKLLAGNAFCLILPDYNTLKKQNMKRCLIALLFLLPIGAWCQTTIETTKQSAELSKTKDSVVEKVEVEASVGRQEWITHLQQTLGPVILHAAKKGMKVGTYVVNVRFLVEKDGSINDVVAINDPGYGLAKGAVKAVKTGPVWSPGSIKGRPVRSYHTQPISFVIADDK